MGITEKKQMEANTSICLFFSGIQWRFVMVHNQCPSREISFNFSLFAFSCELLDNLVSDGTSIFSGSLLLGNTFGLSYHLSSCSNSSFDSYYYYFLYFKHIIMVYRVDEKMGKLGATDTTDDFIKFFWSKFVDF